MSAFPYELFEEALPRLGLVVLQVDETIEQDFRRLFPPEAARIHVSRVPSGAELTPDTIAQMKATLPAAAALLPPAARFDAVGYACTSGTTLIGAARVAELVSGAVQSRAVTDPLSAALAACRALGLERVGIVSPYIAPVAEPIRQAFEAAGLSVPDTLSFGEEVEARVARIAPASIAEAARTLARRNRIDGVFLSCTNLRTLDIIAPLEAELGMPVLSSNQVLGWHMAHLSGARIAAAGHGRLLAT
ncbi:MAG: aspartate/glutamate racemase family protein [Thioclava marina]|uniref:maleate cis-trans isomerase family protein n=1 Tax=Thioclava marina TaxID=1915077 RepID=UPI0019BAB485|nr:Asp/Glu racemase [Thioclava marina]MBC7145144.1 aspartate/glutamate racemase family protein [Thioclava marina]